MKIRSARRPFASRGVLGHLLLWCSWIAVSLTGPLVAQEEASAPAGSYMIGQRDLVEVRVVELPEEFGREFEVGEDGTLLLPVIGLIEASGRTESQLAADIQRRLEAEGLRRASVSVRVSDFRSRPVAILGAVVAPGPHFVPGRSSLLEVLLAAGGLSAEHGSRIQIRRRASNGLSDQVTIRAEDLFERGDPAVNLPIFAGDVIHVPPARTVQISFLGEVERSSVTFKSTERITLLIAIARAGGLSAEASNKIRILRRDQAGEQQEIAANYRRILAGNAPDVALQDGDIVVVKESFF